MFIYKFKSILSYHFRLIREILLKQKLVRGEDLKKLTDSTNENVKKISIVRHETKEVSVNSFNKSVIK